MSTSLEALKSTIEAEGLSTYPPHHPVYRTNTLPWSLAYDHHPSLLLIPTSIPQLQAAIKHLYTSDLTFAVRGRGCGSASASDVLISLSDAAFQSISVVSTSSDGAIIDVAAGTEWGDVDRFVEENLPGHAVVGARCPYVGVTGSTLTGGFSWLSHELGLSSDPKNLLDVQVILHDGSLVWASEHDPELLWALRGGGSNFGVVVKLRFRAHPYAEEVFAGLVLFPEKSVREVSRQVARWTNETHDVKTAMHVFVVDANAGLALHGGSLTPSIMVLLYDGNGEAHGRSEAGFKWAFDVPGAEEADGRKKPRDLSLREVHEMQRSGQDSHGVGCSWLEAALVGEGEDGKIDDEFLVRAWEWFRLVVQNQSDLARGSFVLLEIMQTPAFTSGGGSEATGWPHGQKGRRHVLQLSTGCEPMPEDRLPAVQERALKLMSEAPAFISGKEVHPNGDFLPNFILPNHNLQAVFSSNWSRLKGVKRKFDQRERFNASFSFPVD